MASKKTVEEILAFCERERDIAKQTLDANPELHAPRTKARFSAMQATIDFINGVE